MSSLPHSVFFAWMSDSLGSTGNGGGQDLTVGGPDAGLWKNAGSTVVGEDLSPRRTWRLSSVLVFFATCAGVGLAVIRLIFFQNEVDDSCSTLHQMVFIGPSKSCMMTPTSASLHPGRHPSSFGDPFAEVFQICSNLRYLFTLGPLEQIDARRDGSARAENVSLNTIREEQY